MKKAVLLAMLAAGSIFEAPRFSVGVSVGAPGPGYTWVDGYYAPDGYWVAGSWAPPAVAPRYDYDRDDYRSYHRDRDDDRRFGDRDDHRFGDRDDHRAYDRHDDNRHEEHFRR